MTKYSCTVIFDASATVEVEAGSPEEAASQAEDMACGRQYLCHQCSKELNTGDSIGVHVYNEECDEQLLDTTYKPKRDWVGLTDQECIDIIQKDDNYKTPIKLLQAVMDALKEKNA